MVLERREVQYCGARQVEYRRIEMGEGGKAVLSVFPTRSRWVF